MIIQYKPPETTSGDLNTPVTFFTEGNGGFIPGQKTEEDLYFCLAEMYEASVKDYEAVDTTNAEYIITLLFPNPHTDYSPKYNHLFKIDNHMYQDIKFKVQKISPQNNLIKVVGVSYVS